MRQNYRLKNRRKKSQLETNKKQYKCKREREEKHEKTYKPTWHHPMVLLLRVVSNVFVLGRRHCHTYKHEHTQTHAKWKSVVQSIHSCNRIEIDYTVSARAASIYSFSIEMAFKLTVFLQQKKSRTDSQTNECIYSKHGGVLFLPLKNTNKWNRCRKVNWARERKKIMPFGKCPWPIRRAQV